MFRRAAEMSFVEGKKRVSVRFSVGGKNGFWGGAYGNARAS
jgi:hypothetical protein